MSVELELMRSRGEPQDGGAQSSAELFRRAMPIHAACEGTWDGIYTELDEDCGIIRRYASQLNCALVSEPESAFAQTNTYSYEDGRVEKHAFRGVLNLGRIWWNTERMFGCASEAGDGQTAFVTWTRKDIPGSQVFEMVQFNRAMTERRRVWQWFENDRLIKRVIVDERRAATTG